MTENEIAREIVDAALKVHRALGPGLLESVYEIVLASWSNAGCVWRAKRPSRCGTRSSSSMAGFVPTSSWSARQSWSLGPVQK